MLNITKTTNRREEFLNHLYKRQSIQLDLGIIRRSLAIDTSTASALKREIEEIMCVESKFTIVNYTKNDIFKYLIDYAGMPEASLINPNTSRFSLNKDEILEPLHTAGVYEPYFIDLLYKLSNVEAASNRMNKVIERNRDGVVSYITTDSTTGRIYYKDENIQGFPVRYKSAITAPPGYVLAWGDLSAADFRVAMELYLMEESIKELFMDEPDPYKALAKIIDPNFDDEKFMADRPKYKTSVLASLYRSSIETIEKMSGDRDFAVMLDGFFKNNRRYSDYMAIIEEAIKDENEINLESYFGYQMTEQNTSKTKTISRCFNYPIQSTTQGIIEHLVCAFIDLFGVDKAQLYITRHDEPVMLIHESALDKLWKLKELSQINVDDWTPIPVEWFVGYNFGVPDENLMKMLETDRRMTGVIDKPAHFDFCPISEVLEVIAVYSEGDIYFKGVGRLHPKTYIYHVGEITDTFDSSDKCLEAIRCVFDGRIKIYYQHRGENDNLVTWTTNTITEILALKSWIVRKELKYYERIK